VSHRCALAIAWRHAPVAVRGAHLLSRDSVICSSSTLIGSRHDEAQLNGLLLRWCEPRISGRFKSEPAAPDGPAPLRVAAGTGDTQDQLLIRHLIWRVPPLECAGAVRHTPGGVLLGCCSAVSGPKAPSSTGTNSHHRYTVTPL
jgi:hypothetical protein